MGVADGVGCMVGRTQTRRGVFHVFPRSKKKDLPSKNNITVCRFIGWFKHVLNHNNITKMRNLPGKEGV